MTFPHLFSPFTIKSTEIRNRIFSTGHDTYLPVGGLPTEALIAYQRARARGGAGLIIVQVVGVHETSRYTEALLMGTSDDCIPHFRRLIDAIHGEGSKCFVQLFHPGRELLGRTDGILQTAYAPSHSPSERFKVIPRAMTIDLIGEIVEGYGQVARRMAEAGADGVEIVASHGYLPAQFMNPTVNRRDDRYGGTPDNRLRFTREAIAAVRTSVPQSFIVGMRMSGDEHDQEGLNEDSSLAIARTLAPELDYLNVIAGTSASNSGAVHIAPSMAHAHGYVAPFAQKVKQATGTAVFVAGRINQPQEAERILAQGAADMCGMTRAMICDPEMANKAKAGATDDIRACIGCNQACIGHFQLGIPISCIQHPETGRELDYGAKARAARPRRIMVVGGGPAGLKAAAVAAERGHRVDLHERESQTGGQVKLAQLLPTRAEFGGLSLNLTREAERHGARIHRRSEVTAEMIAAEKPDAVILATGSRLHLPPLEGEAAQMVHGADVLAGRARTGARVVVYDWHGGWEGAGLAEKLASEGAHVRLAVNGMCVAANIQNYIRFELAARLHRLGVEIHPWLRLYGADGRTAYFIHTASRDAVVFEDVDSLVLSVPNHPVDELAGPVKSLGIELHMIGDCLAPRTAEEAVYEGLKAGMAV
ncbi:MAG: FAD-dependent oxidoreductase [Rhizobiales bacterium]|nr:FAD-dependent oxidoreductase [Hyphomicrobiales bacterium]MBI3674572.1 FAD-dependent oxidoreductase [Hyphomicrobiales bacterium]